MCMEILVPNAAVRNLIREDKIHQIYSAMQSGQEKYGMQTFNQALATAYFQNTSRWKWHLTRSSNQDELQEMISRGATLNQSKPGSAGQERGAWKAISARDGLKRNARFTRWVASRTQTAE